MLQVDEPHPWHSRTDAQYGMDGMGRRGLLLSLVDRTELVSNVPVGTRAELINRWEVRTQHEGVCLLFLRIGTLP